MDISRLLAMRDQAVYLGDLSMVAEINAALDLVGYRELEPAGPVRETAVNPPTKRKPGRPRKT